MTLIAVGLIAVSCSTPCPPVEEPETIDMDAVKTEIMALEAAYETAENERNVDGVMVYYAEDAISFPPEHPALVGKAAIRERIEGNMSPENTTQIKFETMDVWAAGELATETGKFTVMNADGETLETGTYVSVFEKRDGKYVCVRDIWNEDSDHDDDMDDMDMDMEEDMD